MLLLIDNYDSFTYNIVQVLQSAGAEVHVVRNNAITLQEAIALKPERLLISPGPGNPDEAGISVEAIKHFAGRLPVLGVCLGHQSLAAAFGGRIVHATRLMHGKTSMMQHDNKTVYAGLPNPFEATRYHSLIVERDSLSNDFEISSWTDENEIMGIRHKPTGAEGVQFHPESILSVHGQKLLEAFLTCT